MSGYQRHPEANLDLVEIADCIATDNPDAARRLMSEIQRTMESLVPFPHRGHRRPDLTGRPLVSSLSTTT